MPKPFQLAFNAYQGANELNKDTCQATFKILMQID